MRRRPLIEVLWRRDLPRSMWPLWAALTPASAIYAGALELRNRWWRGWARGAEIPTISVGNLTVGGNSKTPFTLFLASRLHQRGLATGIVSRGWRSQRRNGRAILVADGSRILLGAREAGDEAAMMARSFAGPVAIGRRRIDAIELLARRFPLKVVVMDDAFQHLRLRRDFDIVLVSETRGFGNGWILPAGPMREKIDAVGRADAVVLMESHGESAITAAQYETLATRPVIHARLRPESLVSPDGNGGWVEMPLELKGRPVMAFSGIADARGFHAMLSESGATLVRTVEFGDHHDYSPYDFENILTAARSADLIVTTEKDLVKLELFPSKGIPLYALRVRISMEPTEEVRLFGMITDRVEALAEASAAKSAAAPSISERR